jgi:hypothetical protein
MNRVLIIAMMTVAAFAQDPYHFEQDVLGESLASYQQNNSECPTAKLKTDAVRRVQFCQAKPSTLTFATAKVLEKRVGFLRGRLYLVTMTFSHADFNAVSLALSEKFGQPVKARSTDQAVLITIAEVMGSKEMTQEQRKHVPRSAQTKEWANGISTISLSEYDATDPTFNTSTVSFTLDELIKEVRDNATKSVNQSRDKAKSGM